MILNEIILHNYKSIKSCSLKLNGKNFITIIGKNGYGKTNVLKALQLAFSKPIYRLRNVDIPEFYAESVYTLTDTEINQYSSSTELNLISNNQIRVWTKQGDLQVKYVDAPFVIDLAKDLYNKLIEIEKQIKTSTNQYLKLVQKIETDYSESYYIDYDFNSLDTITSYDVKMLSNNLKLLKEELSTFIHTFFKDNGEIAFSYDDKFPFHHMHILNYLNLKKFNTDVKIKIHPITVKALGLNKEQVDRANEKIKQEFININTQLDEIYDQIQKSINDFKAIYKCIEDTFSAAEDQMYDANQQNIQKTRGFINLLKKNSFRNVYYIDNENSLFFHSANNYNSSYIFNTNVIIDAIHKYLTENNVYEGEETIHKQKEISPDRLKKIVNKLNKDFMATICPDFDKKTNISYTLKIEDSIKLYVKELDKNEVDFNETSLGRRWYLTYKFIQSILLPGDLLLIDEPAAFLHPQAQEEVRNELEELSKQGIMVIIATHSPNMISRNIEDIVNVEINEKGTTIKSFSKNNELYSTIKNELGINPVNEILFNLSKTILLVEGYLDKICIEKYASLKNISLENYQIVVCNGSAIILMANFCIEEGVKFKALLDRDNLEKPKEWLKNQVGYKDYIEKIKQNTNCVFTPQIANGTKSIEDLFSESDKKKLFAKKTKIKSYSQKDYYKPDPEKVINATEFDDETNANFDNIFKELEIV